MKTLRVVALLVLAPFGVSGSVSAQTVADSAAIVLQLARELQAEGKDELAESLLRLLTARFPQTEAADSARERLVGMGAARDKSGGVGAMTAWGGLYGAWLGLAIPAALGADQSSAYGAGLLVGAPTGILAARSYARASGLNGGGARAIAWGSIWGSFQGVGWREVLEIGDRQETICGQFGCSTFTSDSDRAPWAAAVIGGLAGIGTAAVLAQRRNLTSGTVAAVQWGSLWGSWFGIAAVALSGSDGGEHGGLTTALIAGNVGLLTAAVLAPRWNLTPGRPWLVSAVGLAGLVAGLGVDLIIEPDDDQVAVIPPLAGSIVGLLAGVRMTRPRGISGLSAVTESPGLLQVSRGGLSLGEPVVTPEIRPMPAPRGRIHWRPAVRISAVTIALP